jgi:SpoU rRNA Methylase family
MSKVMEDNELINIWKTQDTQINQNVSLNQNTLLETLRKTGKSTLWGLQIIRWIGIFVGIIWCLGVSGVLIIAWNYSNIFFKSALIINLLCTATAVFLYAYHLQLLRVFNALPVAVAQQRLIALRNSNLKTFGILWLQLPVFSMWYITDEWMRDSPYTLWFIHFPLVLVQAYIGFWIYRNFDYKNHDKKWFRWFISQGEFKNINKAMSILAQIEELNPKKSLASPESTTHSPNKKTKDPWRELLILDGGWLMYVIQQILDMLKPLAQKYLLNDVSSLESETYQYKIHENLSMILHNVQSTESLISAGKTAVALGIPKIYLAGNSLSFNQIPNFQIPEKITWQAEESTQELLQKLKNQGITILGWQTTQEKTEFKNWIIDPQKQYALVFGNEVAGLDIEIKELCDQILEIPPFGSADLSLTLNVVMWEVVKRMN